MSIIMNSPSWLIPAVLTTAVWIAVAICFAEGLTKDDFPGQEAFNDLALLSSATIVSLVAWLIWAVLT